MQTAPRTGASYEMQTGVATIGAVTAGQSGAA